MDDLIPGSDESIIKKFPRIIISGKRYELVLTSRRFLLVETETGQIRREINYPDIVLAVQGVNPLKEPTITVTSISPGGGERQTEELIFVHSLAGQNVQACDTCMDILRERGVPTRTNTRLSVEDAVNRARATANVLSGGVTTSGRPAVPDFSPFGATYKQKQATSEESKGAFPSGLTIAAALIVIFVVIAGFIVIGSAVSQKSPQTEETPNQGVSPSGTSPPSAQLSPVPTPTVTETTPPVPTPVPRSTLVPENGIWVRIEYPGNYTGNLKAEGWRIEVNSTGISDYNLPVHDTLIEGAIEKMDGSGDVMTVGVYNGGSPVFRQTTTKPHGVIELHQEVGPAMGGTVYSTPTEAVAAIPTPDPSLTLHAVPGTGVWVRVAYDGNVTGSISANSFATEVNSSGDKFYQMSMTSGTVEGFLEKLDGSTRDLVVQVYKDGSLVTALNTSRPQGVLDFHTTV